MVLWVIFMLLTVMAVYDVVVLSISQNVVLLKEWHNPPLIMGNYFGSTPSRQNSYLYVNRDFLQYYFFSVLLFVAYFYWYHELNDDDELTLALDARMPSILFDKRLARLVEINMVVPLLAAVITGNLCPDKILTISQALNITASIQLVCCILFVGRFCCVWKAYKRLKRNCTTE